MMTSLLLLAVEQVTAEVSGVACVTAAVTGALLYQHRQAIKQIHREAAEARQAAPAPQITVQPPQVVVHPPQITVQPPQVIIQAAETGAGTAPRGLQPAAPCLCETEVCKLLCEAIAATRAHVQGCSVRYTPDQVQKAAVQMVQRMAKGRLPAGIEKRVREELSHG